MAEPKTVPNDGDVEAFLASVENDQRRGDCRQVMEMMAAVTGHEPRMWGDSLIGFGSYHYVYASGREGDWPLTAVSPRKQNLTVYIMSGFDGTDHLLARLGRHRTGKSCLYLNRLDTVDLDVLRELVENSVDIMRERHP
ncbi:MAG: DUF1801 domain-containing protein [Gemmatimonadota bacterium]|jgi:hypothetical protein